ncbi:MAG: hypothetical protein GWP03_00775 [Proteobacteria bacterium]|nr:hypothetical protein [Pseudomonadota bacterium]
MKRMLLLILFLPIFGYGITLNYATSANGKDISGNNQTAYTNSTVKQPLIVTVTDSTGKPIAGVPVKFAFSSGPEPISIPDTILYSDNFGNVKIDFIIPSSQGKYMVTAFSNYKGNTAYLNFIVNVVKKSWLLVLIIKVLGGFALFLFGLKFSANGLKRYAGEQLKHFLWEYTSNPIKAYLAGIVLTFLLQSSTALSVMLVSLTNAGLISFSQNIAVLLGSALGTTLTVQIIAFNIYDYALLIVIIGFILMNLKGKIHYIGRGIFGFGVIFFAISIMAGAIYPVKNMPWFTNMFLTLKNQWLWLFLISFIITALVHSSALTIGVAILLAMENIIPVTSAFIIVLGANLGTSSTALLASIPSDSESRRTAVSNFLFKLIMVTIVYFALNFFTRLTVFFSSNPGREIANFHTLINLVFTLFFLVFTKPYAKLIKLIIRSDKGKPQLESKYLDEKIIDTPELAIGNSQREIIRVGDTVGKMLKDSITVLATYNNELRKSVIAKDDIVDNLVIKITRYITAITRNETSENISNRGITLLYIVDEFENIGDIISKTLMDEMNKLIKGNLSLSEEGKKDLVEFFDFVLETHSLAMNSIVTWDINLVNELISRRVLGVQKLNYFHKKHLERISNDIKPTIETSAIHLDMISAIERMNYHFVRIGMHIKDNL